MKIDLFKQIQAKGSQAEHVKNYATMQLFHPCRPCFHVGLCSYRVRLQFISLTGQGSGGGVAPVGVAPAAVPPDCASSFRFAGFRFTMLSTPLPTSWKSGVPDFCESERETKCRKVCKAHIFITTLIGNRSISTYRPNPLTTSQETNVFILVLFSSSLTPKERLLIMDRTFLGAEGRNSARSTLI